MNDSIYTVKMTQSGNANELFVSRLERAEHCDIQVAVKWNKASRIAGCGLQLGVSGETQYTFAFSATGLTSVSLIKVAGHKVTEHQRLTEATLTPRVVRNPQDTLTVKVRGPELSFFVNDWRVTRIINTVMLQTWSLIVFAHGHQNVSFTSSGSECNNDGG